MSGAAVAGEGAPASTAAPLGVRDAFRSGWREAGSSLRLSFFLWIPVAAAAGLGALPFLGVLSGALGSSLDGEAMVARLDVAVLAEIVIARARALGAAGTAAGAAAAAYLLLTPFLTAGTLGSLRAASGIRLETFARAGGAHYFAFLRILLAGIAALGAFVALPWRILAKASEALFRESPGPVGPAVAYGLRVAAAGALLAWVLAALDAARIRCVEDGRKKALRHVAFGLLYAARQYGRLLGLYARFAIVFAALAAVYLVLEGLLATDSPRLARNTFLLGQAWILLRGTCRIAHLAAARRYFLAHGGPLPGRVRAEASA